MISTSFERIFWRLNSDTKGGGAVDSGELPPNGVDIATEAGETATPVSTLTHTAMLRMTDWVERRLLDDSDAVCFAALEQLNAALSWENCLRLVNARSRYHRFYDADDHIESLDVGVKSNVTDGVLEVFRAPVQQKLPREIKSRFIQENMCNRIKIMWEMLEYAKKAHGTVTRIGGDDFDGDLWVKL